MCSVCGQKSFPPNDALMYDQETLMYDQEILYNAWLVSKTKVIYRKYNLDYLKIKNKIITSLIKGRRSIS
jgi:hypothetical protein